MSSQLHFRPKELLNRIEPHQMGMRLTSAQRLEVRTTMRIDSGAEEVVLVCIEGSVNFQIEEVSGTAELRDMLYLPARSSLTVTAIAGVLMKFGAPCERATTFNHIAFEDVNAGPAHNVYGNSDIGTRRDVWNFIDESFDSSRFLVGLCSGSNGGWTAWPPHEHGDKREETYVYFDMGDSFAAQFVYDEDAMDDPYTVALVRNGHLVSVPRGYHPSCGSPAGGIFYAYCMVSLEPEDRNFMDLNIQPVYGNSFD